MDHTEENQMEVPDMQKETIQQERETAQANFNRWFEALLTKDPEKVAKLYAPNNTFLPTFSGPLRRGPKATGEYFIEFLQKNPEGSIDDEEVEFFTPDIYKHTGLYTFMVGEDGKKIPSPARFTFIWVRGGDGRWLIDHHHSNPMSDEE